MPKLIVTSRYLKSGGQKNLANYIKYIATRQGSVAVKQNSGTAPATDAQRKLIDSLLKDFPDSKEMLEYIDYQQFPTQKSASAFITEVLERNADRLANRENYVNYLANRPGAVKFGSHGLFSSEDKPIDLEAVAKEIANHGGNVWTHVVSLRRDDAQRMGYDTLEAWRNLVKRQIPNIAKAQKIDLANLRWYAAFHDKQTNPHVHIVVYSTDEHEGFLTKQGIEKIRSGFANDIYADELHHLYAQQTDLRNLLKQQSADLMHRLAAEIQSGTSDAELCDLILHLYSQLANAKGKKVYGYLKPQVKRTVDRIFERLAEHESIQKMYALWCDMEQQKHDVYSSAKVDFPSLSENPQFHSVRNMIVRTCAEMDVPVLEEQAVVDGHPPQEVSDELTAADFMWNEGVIAEAEVESRDVPPHIRWSEEYKEACEQYFKKDASDAEKAWAIGVFHAEAEKGNLLALYNLGQVYASDLEASAEYYRQALEGFQEIEPLAKKMQPYLQYRIGKMYSSGLGTEQDYSASLHWFSESAQAGNKFAQFSLANQHYYGKGAEKDVEQAFHWYSKSAGHGQPYAAYALARMYENGEYVPQNEATAQDFYRRAFVGFQRLERGSQEDEHLLCKLGWMHQRGLGTPQDMQKALTYFHRAAKLGSRYAQKIMALAYLSGEHIPQNVDLAMKMLTRLAETKDDFAAYQLGRVYLFGTDGVPPDKEKAAEWLTKSAEAGNTYADDLLRSMVTFENRMLSGTVAGLLANLARCIEDDYYRSHQKLHSKVERKLRRMIQQKKLAQGIKEEQTQTPTY